MALFGMFASLEMVAFLIFITLTPVLMQEAYNLDSPSLLNCTTSANFIIFHPTNSSRLEERNILHHRDFNSNQHFNKYFDDESVNIYPNNRPAKTSTDNKYKNKYFDDSEINRHNDDQDFRDLREQVFGLHGLDVHIDEQSQNNDLEEHLKVQPLKNYRNDENSSKDIEEDEVLNKKSYEKQRSPNKELNKEINKQPLDHTFYNKYINRYPGNRYQNIKQQSVNTQPHDQYLHRNPDEETLQTVKATYLDTFIKDQTNKIKYVDDVDTTRNFNEYNLKTHKYSDENIGFADGNIQNQAVNEQNNKHRESLHMSDTPLDNQNFARHLVNQNPNTHFNEKYNNKQTYKQFDKTPDNQYYDERFIEQNLEKPFSDQHTNRYLNERNFERHSVGQYIEGILDANVHSDRRLSDENYDRRVVNKNVDEYKEPYSDDKLNKLHSDEHLDARKILYDETTTERRKESNASHLMTLTFAKDWEENTPKLNFPKKLGHEKYRMTTLHLDQGLFIFDFLRSFLRFIQPRNIPLDLLKETLEGQVNISTLLAQSMHVEMAFVAVMSIFIVLMFIVPGIELWLCCRTNKYNYQRQPQRGSKLLFLSIFAIILGMCVMTMLVCNEEVTGGVARIPDTVEAALEDLKNYHSSTAVQLRKFVTRSLDVASEAILADLDNVEELLGKPVQDLLSSEIGADVALDMLMGVENASQELAYKTDSVLLRAERAREFGSELSQEANEMRRELERTSRDCAPEDRSLCAVLDPSGLHLALRLDRIARDDRLLRLRSAGRDNLTESVRQARGEYLYIPQHVSRTTLEARNLIRREINTARAKVSDDTRIIEVSDSDISNQLEKAEKLSRQIVPYIRDFENRRWIVGFGITMCVLFIWLLLLGALCCRCGSSENKMRSTLLWFVVLSCFISIALWLTLMASLAIASHAEMILCRPLDDPEFRTIEAILETKMFLGRRLNIPLKDLLQKCEESDSSYPAIQLDNTEKLEQLTAHWTWSGLSRATAKLKVDLSGLRILSPNLRDSLQNLLYASGPNLTEHRIMIQGPILNKDLNALSDQVENVARQMTDRRTARNFQTLAVRMRDLLSRRVKPLMKMQDELVYQLASLELQMQPLQRQVNQSLAHLHSIQYYIDNQGEKIGQLKAKAYVDRLNSFLEQWRTHVLTEMSSEVSKCRPLWDILRGIKLLFCSHILGPLNGLWFAILICVLMMLISTPTAHNLASSYSSQRSCKGSVLLTPRQGSPDTVLMERETWRTPQ
ncbi:PREDICTED: prominin-2 [Ceratosolen solmsi marchali]|uniref:Prominin-2 n=1 Tax=Ceratosolen solmsi marchali TaxID=326594 RepID=A0AAJ6YWM0_9HYME|nr:PREDICTED: prominin-2 [Ceratosolen solmsi marchali]